MVGWSLPSLLISIFLLGCCASDEENYIKGCDWVSDSYFCSSAPVCPEGRTEIGRMISGKSDIADFGEICLTGHKVLCCKNSLIGAPPSEHCHLFTSPDCSRRCLFGKERIAQEDKKINMFAVHCTLICCDPGTVKKEEDW